MSSEDRNFGSDFPRLADMRAPALTGILALGVFTDDDPVKSIRGKIGKWRDSAAEDTGGPDVCVLLEGLANGKTQTPERNVVGNVWCI